MGTSRADKSRYHRYREAINSRGKQCDAMQVFRTPGTTNIYHVNKESLPLPIAALPGTNSFMKPWALEKGRNCFTPWFKQIKGEQIMEKCYDRRN